MAKNRNRQMPQHAMPQDGSMLGVGVGMGGQGANDLWMPLLGWDLMTSAQSREAMHGLILATQSSAVRAAGRGRASCKCTPHFSFVQVDAQASKTTQPDKERNSCVQLTALRLTAFHLPWRLSPQNNGNEGGSYLRHWGAAAGDGRLCWGKAASPPGTGRL